MRLLALISFWTLMTIWILVATILVVCVYFPLIVLKALWTAFRNLGNRQRHEQAKVVG